MKLTSRLNIQYQFQSQRILASNTNGGEGKIASIDCKGDFHEFFKKIKKKKIPPPPFTITAAAIEKFLQLAPELRPLATRTVIATSKKSHDRKTINHVLARRSTSFTIRIPDPTLLWIRVPVSIPSVSRCCIFMQPRETSSPLPSPLPASVQRAAHRWKFHCVNRPGRYFVLSC